MDVCRVSDPNVESHVMDYVISYMHPLCFTGTVQHFYCAASMLVMSMPPNRTENKR